MKVCEEMGLDRDTYSVTIPLGATINMDGAAITITVMTMATAFTLGIHVDIPTAIILSLLAALSACGASGVAGGSLLLIPMACSLFGISDDISMQVVAVGFIIGVVQDSVEATRRRRRILQAGFFHIRHNYKNDCYIFGNFCAYTVKTASSEAYP